MEKRDHPDDAPPAKPPTEPAPGSIDETVAASFPASDPPAVWTWEVARPDEDATAED